MIRALVLDFDGLILETETPAYESWAEIFREHGHELPQERWLDHLGRGVRWFDAAAHLAELVGRADFDRHAVRARREARKDALVAALEVMAGVRGYVDDARALGLGLGIASSSSRRWVVGHLERLGLGSRWDVVCCRDDVANAKPAPDLYEAAVRALGVAPEEALAFEDSYNGVAAAKAAGLRCVAVPNAITGVMDFSHADLRVASLADMPLKELLALL